MIFGSYPCCDAPLAIAMTDRSGFVRELCPSCGAPVWHRMSRLSPESWTEEEFLKEHRVDEATKQITEITPVVKLEDLLTPDQLKRLADEMHHRLLYGDGGPEPRGILNPAAERKQQEGNI